MSNLFTGIDGNGAEMSEDGVYRYTLTREWDDGQCVLWLMANPSTASASEDDATVRKCVGFAKRWGYGRMVVVNLYAVRNRDPKALKKVTSPIGPLNNFWIKQAIKESREIICAWGCGEHLPDPDGRVRSVLALTDHQMKTLSCLGYRKDGHPRHPLMLSYGTPREPFIWRK